MLPHQAILYHIPPTSSSRRRTIHFGPYSSSDRTSIDQLHVRELTVDRVGLGCALWDGSIVLSRFIYDNNELFAGKKVLELGSGIGLPGLMAARYSSHVTLTDYIDEIIDNIHYNVKINTNMEEEVGEDGANSAEDILYKKNLKQRMKLGAVGKVMDWHGVKEREGIEEWKFDVEEKEIKSDNGDNNNEIHNHDDTNPNTQSNPSSSPSSLPSLPSDPLSTGPDFYDLLIGSEIMYTTSSPHRHSLCKTINYYLKPNGILYLLQSSNREGVDKFIKLIVGKYGFKMVGIERMGKYEGNYWMGNKKPKGFVQREEEYYLFTIQKYSYQNNSIYNPPLSSASDIDIAVVAPAFPTLKYAMDEDKIRGEGMKAGEKREEIEKVMNEVVENAWKDGKGKGKGKRNEEKEKSDGKQDKK